MCTRADGARDSCVEMSCLYHCNWASPQHQVGAVAVEVNVMSIMSMNSIISIVFKMVKTGLSISVSHLCLILRWTGY